MALQFAQVVKELGQGIALDREAEGGTDGFVDLGRAPASTMRAAVKQYFRRCIIRMSWTHLAVMPHLQAAPAASRKPAFRELRLLFTMMLMPIERSPFKKGS